MASFYPDFNIYHIWNRPTCRGLSFGACFSLIASSSTYGHVGVWAQDEVLEGPSSCFLVESRNIWREKHCVYWVSAIFNKQTIYTQPSLCLQFPRSWVIWPRKREDRIVWWAKSMAPWYMSHTIWLCAKIGQIRAMLLVFLQTVDLGGNTILAKSMFMFIYLRLYLLIGLYKLGSCQFQFTPCRWGERLHLGEQKDLYIK